MNNGDSAFRAPLACLGFLLSLIIPFKFYAGSLLLSPYRVYLLVTFMPCLFRLISGKAGRVSIFDGLIFSYGVWVILSLSFHLGAGGGLESGGILAVELIGAYLLARSTVRTHADFRNLFTAIRMIMLVLFPILLLEAVTGKNVFGFPGLGAGAKRMGLYRAQGPFPHAIHFGMFAASSMAIQVALTQSYGTGRKLASRVMCGLMVVFSVSSGALATMTVQLGLLAWRSVFLRKTNKWVLFLLFLGFLYVAVALTASRPPIRVALTYLTFSAHTAYNRLTIFEYGKMDVINNPVFGIGFGVWSKPSWMHSDSMDNFWLVCAVRYGAPALIFLAGGIFLILMKVGKSQVQDGRRLSLNSAWVISMVGIVIGGTTVHFWNELYVFFGFLVGTGVCLGRPAPAGKRV